VRRRLRVRDILGLPLVVLGRVCRQARRDAQIAARRRRADYRRPGSLTYNRQQAQRRYEQDEQDEQDEQPNGP
jgi:hypothetical protein